MFSLEIAGTGPRILAGNSPHDAALTASDYRVRGLFNPHRQQPFFSLATDGTGSRVVIDLQTMSVSQLPERTRHWAARVLTSLVCSESDDATIRLKVTSPRPSPPDYLRELSCSIEIPASFTVRSKEKLDFINAQMRLAAVAFEVSDRDTASYNTGLLVDENMKTSALIVSEDIGVCFKPFKNDGKVDERKFTSCGVTNYPEIIVAMVGVAALQYVNTHTILHNTA